MNPDGQSTSNVANNIKRKLNEEGYDVYSDHGEAGEFIGTIAVSYEEKTEGKLGREEEISQLDIAVMKRNANEGIALVEIEETTDNPKKLIGDIFAVLMGNSIYLPGKKKRKLDVGDWTTLIIIAEGVAHEPRNKDIQNMANCARSVFRTTNLMIGNIVIDSFSADKDLEDKCLEKVLMDKIYDAIQRDVLSQNRQ